MKFKYYPNPDTTSPMTALFLQNGQVSCYFEFGGGYWMYLPNEPQGLIDAVIGPGYSVFGLDNSGHIHYWPYGNPTWIKDLVASKGVAISYRDNFLYCANDAGQVWAKYLGGATPQWYLLHDCIPDGQPIYWEYTVKAGDHLWKIVRENYPVSDPNTVIAIVEQIKSLNPQHTNWDQIHPGMLIKMPPK